MKEEKGRGISRRGLLNLAWIGGTLVALGQLLGVSFAFLWPRREKAKVVKVALAKEADIPSGEGLTLKEKGVIITHPETGILPLADLAKSAGGRKIIGNNLLTPDVVDQLPPRSRESGIVVLSNVCTHLACKASYNPKTKRIECPCHAGIYNLQGEVVSGPPPRPLDRLVFKIEVGEIFIEREERAKA